MRLSSCEVREYVSGWESYFPERNTRNFATFFYVLSSYVDNIPIHEMVQNKFTAWQRFSWKSTKYEPIFMKIAEYVPIFMKIGSVRAVTGGREWTSTLTSHIYIWFASNSTERDENWRNADGQVARTLSIAATAQRTAPRTLLLLPYVACLFFVYALDHLNIHPVLSDSKQGTFFPSRQ